MARELTDAERETLEWAGHAFARPWFTLSSALRRLARGERGELLVDPYFLPFRIDARLVFGATRGGLTRLLLGPNASLFTVVLDDAAEQILWCGVERAEGGVFTEAHVLVDRLGEGWARELVHLLAEDRMDEAFRFVFDWVKTEDTLRHIDVGVLRVAHLAFFDLLRRAWTASGEGDNLAVFFVKALEALRRVEEERLLRFAPDVPLGRLLAVLLPALRALSPVGREVLAPVLRRLPLPRTARG